MMRQKAVLAALLNACLFGGFITAQGTSDPLPNCIIICKPQIAGDGAIGFACEVTCTADEVDRDFIDALTSGDPYIPRFTHPNGCSTPCDFGDEAFEYAAGTSLVLSVGLWTVPGSAWTVSSTVLAVDVFVTPMVSVLVEQDLDLLPWTHLGTGTLNSATGFWEVPWDSSPYDDPAGYLFKTEFLDAALGNLDAYDIARDPNACGFHTFGTYPAATAGANVLTLTGGGGTSPGTTSQLVTAGIVGPGAFTAMTLDSVSLPFLGGTLWVNLVPLVFFTFNPAVGGAAVWNLPVPPSPSIVGVATYSQSLAADASQPAGFALSNGLRLKICP